MDPRTPTAQTWAPRFLSENGWKETGRIARGFVTLVTWKHRTGLELIQKAAVEQTRMLNNAIYCATFSGFIPEPHQIQVTLTAPVTVEIFRQGGRWLIREKRSQNCFDHPGCASPAEAQAWIKARFQKQVEPWVTYDRKKEPVDLSLFEDPKP